MTSADRRLQFRQPNGVEHWSMSVRPLVEDEFGRWYQADAGWEMSRPGRSVVVDHPAVWCLPHRGDYLARFNGARPDGSLPRSEIYVDICRCTGTGAGTGAEGDEVRLTELALDVARRPGGRVELLDEEEMLASIVPFGYSMELVRAAILSSEAVVAAVTLGREPFGGVGWARLREAFGS